MQSDPIAGWHAFLDNRSARDLERLLDPEAVFESPVVHTPQAGRELVMAYLMGAVAVLGNDSFRYLGEWRAERSAVLEFASDLDGIQVNGVDMIWWNAEGRIVRFKVMLRPLKAVHEVQRRMGELLERLKAGQAGAAPFA